VAYLSREPFDGALADKTGEALTMLGVRDSGQYLVRPDGYIGYRSAGRSFDELEKYLAGWYSRPTG
jgi:hypothetical protein